MRNNKLKTILLAIFIAALFLRLFAVFNQEESKRLPGADAKDFDNLAVNIVSGHGFSQVVDGENVPTSFRPPLFPFFLAGIYAIFGHSYIAVKIIQAVLGALLCIVIFFIANTVYNDTRVGVISAIIVALYKPFVSGFSYYGGPAVLYSEYFYMFILGLTILAVLLFIKTESKIFGILSGIFIGLTIYTRFEFVFYPALLFVYLFYISRLSISRFFKKFFVMYVVIILMLMPWVIRNYIVHEKFIPLATLGGKIFWMGNNSLANGGSSGSYTQNYIEIMNRTEDMTEYERDKVFFKEGFKELRNNPKKIPRLFIRKIMVHWAPFEDGFRLFNLYYAVILLFGSIGILFFRRHIAMENVLLILFLITTLTAIITLGDPRYRHPYEFYLIIFAALAMNEIFKRARK